MDPYESDASFEDISSFYEQELIFEATHEE